MADVGGKASRKLNPSEISVFCLQLSLVLKAGMPLYEGIGTLIDEEGNDDSKKIGGYLAQVIQNVNKEVIAGKSLFSALSETSAFPEYMLSMVEIGEQTGKLDVVLEALSDYYERDSYLKTRIRNALVYPIFLFIIMSAVIILLVGNVFPIFEEMLEGLGGELSDAASAASAFASGIAAGKYTMIFMLVITLIVVVVFVMTKTKGGKAVLDKFLASFPLTKKITAKIAASRFSSALAMTLSSGMDTSSALTFASNVVTSNALKEKFSSCCKEIDSGKSFSKSIGKIGIFSDMFIKFIEIGQKTGTTDEVMAKIADMYETETDNSINNVTALIEPILVGALSIVIGIILISVMLPLVSIMSGIS